VNEYTQQYWTHWALISMQAESEIQEWQQKKQNKRK